MKTILLIVSLMIFVSVAFAGNIPTYESNDSYYNNQNRSTYNGGRTGSEEDAYRSGYRRGRLDERSSDTTGRSLLNPEGRGGAGTSLLAPDNKCGVGKSLLSSDCR